MNTLELTITNIHERGFAFAVSEQTGEQCFVPPHVMDDTGVSRGDTVTAQVVLNPNERQRDNTRWCAINILTGGPEDDKEPERTEQARTAQDLDAEVLRFICQDTYVTSSDIARESGVDTRTAGNSAQRLFNAGKIAKADVYAKVGQARPSFILWTSSVINFVEDEQ